MRDYQLIIYGATGFTGGLAAEYVLREYGSKIRWAVAGRSESKLAALKLKLNDVPGVVIADGGDEEALLKLAEATDAVATCAGPFSRYGTGLVKACAKAGTHYADITGETDWARQMICDYDDVARASGAKIVHFCGHDSVPWDLCTLMLHKKLKEKGDSLKEVDFYDEIKGQASGGTLETAMGILLGQDKKKASTLKFDPLLKTQSGEKSASKTKTQNVNAVELFSDNKYGFSARSTFVMAGVNANVVKRSNALLNYGDITYSEGTGHQSSVGAVFSFLGLATFGAALFIPPIRYVLRSTVLPKPGEGPSQEDMLQGYLRVTGVAKGYKGNTVACKMSFKVDAGYMDTARMVTEAALTLSLDNIDLPGGSYTPASCQGEHLLKRLCDTGSTFEYLE